ncbi:pyridoxal phosphate-dependent transferase [Cryomyces antarcticus]
MDMAAEEHARSLDAKDPLQHLRDEFVIPTRADLKRKTLAAKAQPTSSTHEADTTSEHCTYLCGNSLGLQPRQTASYIQDYLSTWASKGVYGHFKPIEDSPLPPWVDIDEAVKEEMAKIVGAEKDEVAVMETLTANLHLLMASFYRPDKTRWKIILEGKAFPSDHYAVESQIRHHNFDPSDAMVLIEPPSPNSPLLPTSHIHSIIDAHASSTALLLLPGIQFYTGQYFDIPTITAHAQSKGITVGWDLAHATGNALLHLHDWNVDFAAWCNYKYMNSGPGAIGGLFVHARHSQVSHPASATEGPGYRPRLAGWWGSDKSSRFAMTNHFAPIPGAGGFQLSNPSALDLTAVQASLSVFAKTSMAELREKSLKLTGYLEQLLTADGGGKAPYAIVTPSNPEERGAQLSIRLESGLLDAVMHILEEEGVVVDERRPDVIRVAPAPLYNSFSDVCRFVQVFRMACGKVVKEKQKGSGGSLMVDGGKEKRGWSEIK